MSKQSHAVPVWILLVGRVLGEEVMPKEDEGLVHDILCLWYSPEPGDSP